MIDYKELRIGNYLKGQDDKAHGEVLEICYIGKHGRATINGWDYKEWSPIPLTPEILEKAGFKKWGVGDKKYPGEVFYHKEPMLTDRLMWSAYEKRVCFCTDTYQDLGHRVFYRPRIDYLHQLQNAFFAFYSQELKINL